MPTLADESTREAAISNYVDRNKGLLIQIIRDLVRIPSENTPPIGAEASCQAYIADFLKSLDLSPDIYLPESVPGLREHPLYFAGRDYSDRPNVAVRKAGAGQGRSLLLSGHIDTVPRGTQPWTRDPFGGAVEGNLLFGRGSNDMKGGVGTNLFVLKALAELDISLSGELLFESVVDEEFGGSNGTLAGRLRGFNADAAIISEPSFLRVCPAQRGGRTAQIILKAAGGILNEGRFPAGVSEQLTVFLNKVKQFAEQRQRRAVVHELYRDCADPVPVSITKVFTSPWGNGEPIGIPEECRIEMYWQTMPGETQQAIEQEFFEWIDAVVDGSGGLIKGRPEITLPLRWLPGSAVSAREPLVTELASCAASVLGEKPPIAGIEGPCDLYVFQQGFNTPAVLWGARGGNTHAADEYLEIDSVVKAAKTLLTFICRWCGVSKN